MQRLIDEAGLSEKRGGKRYKELYDLYRQGQGFADPYDQQLLAEEMQKLVTDPKFEAAVEKNLRTKQAKQLYDTTLKHYENEDLPTSYREMIEHVKSGKMLGEEAQKSLFDYLKSPDFQGRQAIRTDKYNELAKDPNAAPFLQVFEGMKFTSEARKVQQSRLLDYLKDNKYDEARQFLQHSAISAMGESERKEYNGKIAAIASIDRLKKVLEGIGQGYYLESDGTRTPIKDSKGNIVKLKTDLFQGTIADIFRKVGFAYPPSVDPNLSRVAAEIAASVNYHVAAISGMGVTDSERERWEAAYPGVKKNPELNQSLLDGLRAVMVTHVDSTIQQKLGGIESYQRLMAAGKKNAAAAAPIGSSLSLSTIERIIAGNGQVQSKDGLKTIDEASLNRLKKIREEFTKIGSLPDAAERNNARRPLLQEATSIINGSGVDAADVLSAPTINPTPPQARPLGPDESTRVLRINPFEPPSPSSGQASPSASIPAPSSGPSSPLAPGEDGEFADILRPKDMGNLYEDPEISKPLKLWDDINNTQDGVLDGIINTEIDETMAFTRAHRGFPQLTEKAAQFKDLKANLVGEMNAYLKKNGIAAKIDLSTPGVNALLDGKIKEKIIRSSNQYLGRGEGDKSSAADQGDLADEPTGQEPVSNPFGFDNIADINKIRQPVRLMMEQDKSINGELNTIVAEDLERGKNFGATLAGRSALYLASSPKINKMADRLVDPTRAYDPGTKKLNPVQREREVEKVQFELHLEWLRRAVQMSDSNDPRIVYAVDKMKEQYKNQADFEAKIDEAAGPGTAPSPETSSSSSSGGQTAPWTPPGSADFDEAAVTAELKRVDGKGVNDVRSFIEWFDGLDQARFSQDLKNAVKRVAAQNLPPDEYSNRN